jgi:hypothetical protein
MHRSRKGAAGLITLVTASAPFSHKEVLMKATHVLHPVCPVRRGNYLRLTVKIPAPTGLPKEWPTIVPAYSGTWVMRIGMKQWRRVADVLREPPAAKRIVDGAPVYINRQLLLCATAAMSVYIEKQRQEAHGPPPALRGELKNDSNGTCHVITKHNENHWEVRTC